VESSSRWKDRLAKSHRHTLSVVVTLPPLPDEVSRALPDGEVNTLQWGREVMQRTSSVCMSARGLYLSASEDELSQCPTISLCLCLHMRKNRSRRWVEERREIQYTVQIRLQSPTQRHRTSMKSPLILMCSVHGHPGSTSRVHGSCG